MRERGRDFFIMSLARDLKMTRRQLLTSMDSREFTMWECFLSEVGRKQEPPKTDPNVLKAQLENVFAARNHAVKKKRKK